MPITAQPLEQAREALVRLTDEKQALLNQIGQQGQKIGDLEREVQRLAYAAGDAQNRLSNARVEIEGLRSQVPDEPTVRAFESLLAFLSTTESREQQERLRMAA